MIASYSFRMQRSQVEAVSHQFFHLWRLLGKSQEKSLEGQPLDDGTIHWITYLALMEQLDAYFASRLRSGKGKELTITLSTPQAMCLYRAVSHLPLDSEEYYLVHVRQVLSDHLYAFIINLPIRLAPPRRLPAPVEEDEWE